MTITVRTIDTETQNPNTAMVLTLSGGGKPLTGDCVFVVIWWYEDNGAGASASIASSNLFTYNLIGEIKFATNGFAAIYAAYNVTAPAVSEVITVTKADAGNVYGNCAAMAVGGLLTASVVDQSKVSASTAGGSTSHTITCDGANAQAEEIVIAVIMVNTGSNPGITAPPSGYTDFYNFVDGSVGGPGAAGYKILSGVETSAVTFTGLPSGDSRGGVIATFKSATGGGGSTPPRNLLTLAVG